MESRSEVRNMFPMKPNFVHDAVLGVFIDAMHTLAFHSEGHSKASQRLRIRFLLSIHRLSIHGWRPCRNEGEEVFSG